MFHSRNVKWEDVNRISFVAAKKDSSRVCDVCYATCELSSACVKCCVTKNRAKFNGGAIKRFSLEILRREEGTKSGGGGG